MTRNLNCLVALFLGVSTALAQGTFVVPPDYQNAEGESIAYGDLSANQQLVRASEFPVLPTEGVFLTGISYRQDSLFGSGGTKRFSFFHLGLSTNPTGGGSHQPFVPGSDWTLVADTFDPVVLPDPQGAGPQPFNLPVKFERPFYYKPGQDLLIQMWAGNGIPFSLGTLALDFTFSDGVFVSFPPPNGGGDPSSIKGSFAMQFTWMVPEPATEWLLALGILSILLLRRRV